MVSFYRNFTRPTVSTAVTLVASKLALTEKFRKIGDNFIFGNLVSISFIPFSVCTQLSSPEDPRLDRDRLVWQPVDGAHSYRVEMKNGAGQYAQVVGVVGRFR